MEKTLFPVEAIERSPAPRLQGAELLDKQDEHVTDDGILMETTIKVVWYWTKNDAGKRSLI